MAASATPAWLQSRIEDEHYALLSEADARELRDAIVEAYDDKSIELPEPLLQESRARFDAAQPFARGPLVSHRVLQDETQVGVLWRGDTGQRWLALSPEIPVPFWIALPDDEQAAEALCERYEARSFPDRLHLSGCYRAFVGTEAMLEADFDQIVAVINQSRALESDVTWGSAYDDDPWPLAVRQDVDQITIAREARRFRSQASDRIKSISWRSNWTRSIVTLEEHFQGFFVVQVRYDPTTDAETITRLNREFGRDFPADMPIDAAIPLLNFASLSEQELQTQMTASTDAEERVAMMVALASVMHNDMRLAQTLRELVQNSDDAMLHEATVEIAFLLDYRFLLYELAISTPKESLFEQIDSMIATWDMSDEELAEIAEAAEHEHHDHDHGQGEA